MISAPLVRYVLTAAVRDKIVATLTSMILVAAALSVFLGSSAIIEEHSFALVFGAAGLRILGVIGIVLFVSFYIRRAFEHKEVEFMLSRPLTRVTFLLSHAAAFVLLALVLSVVLASSLVIIGVPDFEGLIAWWVSIAAELAIMAASALFFSMVLTSPAGSALACLGLYALARMIGVLLGITEVVAENWIFAGLGYVMQVISVVVPRLDLMGQTSWLVYGVGNVSSVEFADKANSLSHFLIETLGHMGFIGVQGVFFVGLLMAAAAFDLVRRQF